MTQIIAPGAGVLFRDVEWFVGRADLIPPGPGALANWAFLARKGSRGPFSFEPRRNLASPFRKKDGMPPKKGGRDLHE